MQSAKSKKPQSPPTSKPNFHTSSFQLGVWRILITEESGVEMRKRWNDAYGVLPMFQRLTIDIFKLSPCLTIAFVVGYIFSGTQEAIIMYISNHLLRIVELGLVSGKPDKLEIFYSLAARLLCLAFFACLDWWRKQVHTIIKDRATSHFNLLLMRADLTTDLSTSQEASSAKNVSGKHAWEGFEETIRFLSRIMMMASQLLIIFSLARSTAVGPLFSVICTMQPISVTIFRQFLWNKVHVAYISNPHFKRMQALRKLSTPKFLKDVISGNLSNYIIKEYEKAREQVGNASPGHPYDQYGIRPSPFFDMWIAMLGDSPMVYIAICAIMYPSTFSVSIMATLQNASWTLRTSVQLVLSGTESLRRSLNDVKNLYAAVDATFDTMREGLLPYPLPHSTCDTGMGFELKNVSFSYPGSINSSNALTNISLSIRPGEIVVIVGENGGGKSTLLKLLSRLYDPTLGEILIDGQPTMEYRLSDLRQASAILSQDNLLYPLSLSENIGIGHPVCASDRDLISRAAELGGASGFMSKLSKGGNTFLDPFNQTMAYNLFRYPDHPLHEEVNKLEKTVDISGGETQRLVAARTFMRFNSRKIMFLAVDEPSAALDAEGELRLFENIIAARKGKTIVFVTHRFGHLTRYADKIICMKEGSVVENGTHTELMKLGGEYAKLYDIQAKAFAEINCHK